DQLLRQSTGLDELAEIDARLDAHVLAHAGEVLRGEIPRRAGRVRASAGSADGGVERRDAHLEADEAVGERSAVRVVQVQREHAWRKVLQERLEDTARLQRISHANRVAQRELGAPHVAQLASDLQGRAHVDLSLVRAAPDGAQIRTDGDASLERDRNDFAEVLQ